VTAEIGERDAVDGDAAEMHPALEGASLAARDGGVVIQSVAEGSPAARNGLRPNDVIVAVGRVRIASVEQLRSTLRGQNAFAITIRRGNATLVFPIR